MADKSFKLSLSKIIDASLFIAILTALDCYFQWIFLFCYYASYGLTIRDFSLAPQEIILANFEPILDALVAGLICLILLEIPSFQHAITKYPPILLFALFTAFVMTSLSCAIEGKSRGDRESSQGLGKQVFFVIDNKEIKGFYLLCKNNGYYYFYKPALGNSPDIKIVKADSIKELDLQ